MIRSVLRLWVLLAAGMIFQSCAHHFPLPVESALTLYTVSDTSPSAKVTWAPSFVAYGYQQAYNRIGRPEASISPAGNETISIDTERPTVYFMEKGFSTTKGNYTNLIYRIHFSKVPFDLVPFNLTTGNNVGILVVVTLNALEQPVLITTVNTCGCYVSLTPTSYLPRRDLPADWVDKTNDVYGEHLPPVVSYDKGLASKLLVHVRPQVHRVMNLEVVPSGIIQDLRYVVKPLALEDMAALTRLPLGSGTTSFYYENGLLKGHVKGAVKPLETLLLSLISLDLFVGTDKVYGDPAQWQNPFYTSLKPWDRRSSDMWDFARFLRYWGWRL